MNQELIVILNSLYKLDRHLLVMLHVNIYNPTNSIRHTSKCQGVYCTYCPLASYKIKTDHLKETIIQIADLSEGLRP